VYEVDFAELDQLLGARNKIERACPACSHLRKSEHRKLQCFGLMRKGPDCIIFNCMNCGFHGARTRGFGRENSRSRISSPRPASQPKSDEPDLEREANAKKAGVLWRRSRSPVGTLVEVYWLARGLALPIPPTIRFFPASRDYPPALVGALGLPVLDGDDWYPPDKVRGIQLVSLKPDGSWHIGEGAKKSLCIVKGSPLCVHVNPESLALVIGEGIEKTHRLAVAMNVDGWSTCGKSFMPALADVVSQHVQCVTILIDPGAEPEARQLADRLRARGIETRGLQFRGNGHVG
jgi:hypothetical protein